MSQLGEPSIITARRSDATNPFIAAYKSVGAAFGAIGKSFAESSAAAAEERARRREVSAAAKARTTAAPISAAVAAARQEQGGGEGSPLCRTADLDDLRAACESAFEGAPVGGEGSNSPALARARAANALLNPDASAPTAAGLAAAGTAGRRDVSLAVSSSDQSIFSLKGVRGGLEGLGSPSTAGGGGETHRSNLDSVPTPRDGSDGGASGARKMTEVDPRLNPDLAAEASTLSTAAEEALPSHQEQEGEQEGAALRPSQIVFNLEPPEALPARNSRSGSAFRTAATADAPAAVEAAAADDAEVPTSPVVPPLPRAALKPPVPAISKVPVKRPPQYPLLAACAALGGGMVLILWGVAQPCAVTAFLLTLGTIVILHAPAWLPHSWWGIPRRWQVTGCHRRRRPTSSTPTSISPLSHLHLTSSIPSACSAPTTTRTTCCTSDRCGCSPPPSSAACSATALRRRRCALPAR